MSVNIGTTPERQQYLLTVRDGKLVDSSGGLFDTATAKSAHPHGERAAIFVMDPSGNLYAALHHRAGQFHHSSFLAGGAVAGAGELIVERGVLVGISRRSGHYFPSEALQAQVLDRLRELGVNIDNVRRNSF